MRKTIFIKLILVAILGLISNSSLFAQLSVGLKTVPFMPNVSRLAGTFENVTTGKTSEDFQGYSSFVNLGVDINYSLNKQFSLHTGLNYKIQGYEDLSEFEYFSLNYIEIPFLFRYTIGSKTKFFAQVGPSIKFLTKATHEYRQNTVIYENKVNDIYSPSVLVGNIGIGVTRDLSEKFSLNAEWRFGYDFSQTVKKQDNVLLNSGEVWNFQDTHLLSAAITIGITYKIGSTNH